MSIPISHFGTANIVLATDTSRQPSSCLESVTVNENSEVHVGSLGLGTALAVAYDLCNDNGILNQVNSYNNGANTSTTHQLANNILSLSSMKSSPAQLSSNYCRITSDPQQYQYTVYSNLPITNGLSWITQQSDAYLTPIQSSVSFYDCESPTKIHSTNDTDSNNIGNHLNHSKLTSSNLPDFVNNNNKVINYVIDTAVSQPMLVMNSIPEVLTNGTTTTTISLTNSNGQINLTHNIQNGDVCTTKVSTLNNCDNNNINVLKENTDTNHIGASSVDESMYELSEEEMREIDATLTTNADVMASRQWKYYIETNEWTRATCALMACLFTRDQMANSTVLGRGGSRRARLPSNLVAYVVSTIRRRFNKPAAAIRARMAQKCKDERRFGRALQNPSLHNCYSSIDGSGTYEFNDCHSPVAAITPCRSGGGIKRKSKKRLLTSTAGHSNVKTSSDSMNGIKEQSNTPNNNNNSGTLYQIHTMNGDDAYSSSTTTTTADSNQLPSMVHQSFDEDNDRRCFIPSSCVLDDSSSSGGGGGGLSHQSDVNYADNYYHSINSDGSGDQIITFSSTSSKFVMNDGVASTTDNTSHSNNNDDNNNNSNPGKCMNHGSIESSSPACILSNNNSDYYYEISCGYQGQHQQE
ncbi:unnamed protein product [Trichobilharzia szidati]|nr:unnamed protein product [Trichobilharzia szidati]